MGEGYKLRLSTLADAEAIEALIPVSVRGLQSDHYSPAQIAGALGTVFGLDTQLIRDGTYFVAEVGESIVGCGGWSRRKTLFGGDQADVRENALLDPQVDAARVRAFFVHPQWARRGIGSEIMRLSEKAALEEGFRRVEILAALTGKLLYQRFGYKAVEHYQVPLSNGASLPVVRMTKAFDADGSPRHFGQTSAFKFR